MDKKQGLKPLKKLLPKHHIFINEYLLDSNASRAAKVAGYTDKSAPVMAYLLLKDDLIKGEIGRLQAKQLATAGITAQFVLEDLRTIIEEVRAQKTPAFYQVRIRANELLGKHLNLWDNSSDSSQHRKASDLTDKELVALGMELGKAREKEPKTIPATIEDNKDKGVDLGVH